MEFITKASIPVLNNSGVASQQLLFPENSNSTRVTITQVTMPPGKINPTH
ncbi:MAG: cupin domain-containing protein, partial [Burkholderiales bacterium]|nr:cupin domain-containing protein [Burkholderiales bacterium]